MADEGFLSTYRYGFLEMVGQIDWKELILASVVWSGLIGHIPAGGFVELLRWCARKRIAFDFKVQTVRWLVALIGGVERIAATALMIAAPKIVPVFIGAWVLLKFAGGWQRYKEPDVEYRIIYMIALIGNVVSFGWAVLVGLWFHPASLAAFQ